MKVNVVNCQPGTAVQSFQQPREIIRAINAIKLQVILWPILQPTFSTFFYCYYLPSTTMYCLLLSSTTIFYHLSPSSTIYHHFVLSCTIFYYLPPSSTIYNHHLPFCTIYWFNSSSFVFSTWKKLFSTPFVQSMELADSCLSLARHPLKINSVYGTDAQGFVYQCDLQTKQIIKNQLHSGFATGIAVSIYIISLTCFLLTKPSS